MFEARPGVLDGGDQTGGPAETLAFAVVLGRTTGVVLRDRLETGVEVIGVKHRELVLGGGRSGAERKSGCRHQNAGHYRLPLLVLWAHRDT